MRIGILGGSFNPIHFGHLLMAQSALESLKLDQVLFVPAHCSPFKKRGDLPADDKRLSMVKEAIKGNKGFAVYDGEIRRGGVSYTVDTLRELKLKYPKAQFFLLMGADSLRSFKGWKEPKEILNLAKLVVLNRPGFDKDYPKGYKFIKVDMPAVDISSTDMRNRLKNKKSIWYLTSKSVIRYIVEHKLY